MRGRYLVHPDDYHSLKQIQATFRRFGWRAWLCGRIDHPITVCVEDIPEIKLRSIIADNFPGATFEDAGAMTVVSQ